MTRSAQSGNTRPCRWVKPDGSQCSHPASKDRKADGYCYQHMGNQRRRTWGAIRKMRKVYHASYLGPDEQRHNAPTTFSAKLDAEAWLAREKRLVDLGEWSPPTVRAEAAHQAELQARAEAAVFGEYADHWVETRHNKKGQPLKRRSKADYRRLLKSKIKPHFAELELKNITKESVDVWYRTMSKTPSEQAAAYSLFRTILGTAVEEERIAINPCRIQGAGKAPIKHKVEMVTLDELAIIHNTMPPPYRLTVKIGMWCTLRIGEILELRRRDIRIRRTTAEDGTETVVGILRVGRSVQHIEGEAVIDTPKTDAGSRDVHIPPDLIPDFEEHLKDYAQPGRDGLLFPSGRGNPLHHRTFGNWWNKARIAAGRPDLHFHDLRHTGATLAAQLGATLRELMDRLGHTTPKAALVYQHTASSRDQLLAERLSAVMTSSAGQQPALKPRPSDATAMRRPAA